MTWGPFSADLPLLPRCGPVPSRATTIRLTPGVGRPSVSASFWSGSAVVAMTTIGASVRP